ncbi:MAG: HEAT repeat domain-containing protein, partial [Candidatus Binatia bacterium]
MSTRRIGFRSLVSTMLLALVFAAPAPAQVGAPPSERDGLLRRYQGARDGATIEEWVRRLEDPDASVRLGAVKSIAESGDSQAPKHLMAASLDPDPRVASRAVDALGRLRAAEATDFLAERLFTVGTGDDMRRQILAALARIGDARASRPILQFVDRTEDPELRAVAIFAVGEVGDTTVLGDVERIAGRETEPELRRVAREALEKISGRRFEPTP